jgi:transcriptional regulator GlxA family with amidase domain
MGVRPHEYILRRRVERAQAILAGSRLPLCEVALDAGFSSQSQFTTVFGRFVGETPKVWRHRNGGMAPADHQPQHGRA